VDPDRTVYDLASVTKVVATTTAIMILHDERKLSLDDRVARYLSRFRGHGRGAVTIRQLLAHTSGLPAGRDLPRSPGAARRAVLATPLEDTPGAHTLYSDLGPDLLGFIVERVTGEPLDRFLARRVFARLGMHSTGFRPRARDYARLAPTGVYPSRGVVHDPNARALGGVAGHAGLFATASDLAVFAQMMLNGGTYAGRRIVRDSTVALFTRRAAGWRALGWDTCAGGGSCGQYMSERAFGHTGFTGTSLWVDPDRDMFVIVLTNEVHEPRAPDPVAIVHDVRADVADIAARAVDDFGTADVSALPQLRAERAIGWY
jgi:CubicO group peptidase (beta-lactamase class C family)